MLKRIGSYNDFPKEFKQPKLAKGETALYRLLNSVPDPNNKGLERFPPSVKIRSVDRVEIPDIGTYDIGLVRQIDKDGVIQNVRYIKIAAQEDAGYFRVVGGNILDDELYAYIELCNYNGSNPNRDPLVPALFVRVDDEKDAKVSRKKRSAKLQAMTFAENMTLAQVKEFAAARNWNQNDKEDVLRQQVEKFAEENPEAFMKSVNDKDVSLRASIKKAIDAGVIKWDLPQSRYTWGAGGETICQVARVEGVEPFDGLVDFIKTNKRGDAVLAEIIKGTSKAAPAKQAELAQPGEAKK